MNNEPEEVDFRFETRLVDGRGFVSLETMRGVISLISDALIAAQSEATALEAFNALEEMLADLQASVETT